MLIDWFTVAAQIVNFLILVYLLRRFLFRPIVRHMNEREEKIRNRLQQAADKRSEAREKIEEYQRRIEDLDRESGARLEQAEREAQERKRELMAEARKEAEGKRSAWLESLRKEQENFARDLQERSGRQILQVAGQALKELADESLANRLAEVLLARLDKLAPKDRDRLAKAGSQGDVMVRSTCDLDAAHKRKITLALHDLCGKEAKVIYQSDENFPLGIEVKADSVKLSWGTEPYLEELKTRVLALIEDKSRQEKEEGKKITKVEKSAGTVQSGSAENTAEAGRREGMG